MGSDERNALHSHTPWHARLSLPENESNIGETESGPEYRIGLEHGLRLTFFNVEPHFDQRPSHALPLSP